MKQDEKNKMKANKINSNSTKSQARKKEKP